MDIEYKVVEKLIEKGYHITFSESCTAGLCKAGKCTGRLKST